MMDWLYRKTLPDSLRIYSGKRMRLSFANFGGYPVYHSQTWFAKGYRITTSWYEGDYMWGLVDPNEGYKSPPPGQKVKVQVRERNKS